MRPLVYLAGPIFGTTGAEANDWRRDMTARLDKHGIGCISPLRCEPMVGDRYDVAYADPCFGTPRAIVSKNYLDLRTCDFMLAYMPTPPEIAETAAALETLRAEVAMYRAARPHAGGALDTLERIAKKGVQRSIGTIGEISWAKALGKPMALVTDDPLMRSHPFTTVQPDWTLSNLDEAERLLVGLYTDYVWPPAVHFDALV